MLTKSDLSWIREAKKALMLAHSVTFPPKGTQPLVNFMCEQYKNIQQAEVTRARSSKLDAETRKGSSERARAIESPKTGLAAFEYLCYDEGQVEVPLEVRRWNNSFEVYAPSIVARLAQVERLLAPSDAQSD